MCLDNLALEITGRINELKSEQIMLRPFIASDQVRIDALEKAITELNWVLERVGSDQNK